MRSDSQNDLNIGRKEAQAYIDSYFEKYPKIKAFLDKTVSEAKEKGYIKNYVWQNTSNTGAFVKQLYAETVWRKGCYELANTGNSRRYYKIAMIRVHDRSLKENLKSKLILQVHDELLIETAEDEKEYVIELLEEEMHKSRRS